MSEWLPIPGFKMYQCNALGQIRSRYTGKLVKQQLHKGYMICQLNTGTCKRLTVQVHKLIAAAFLGECPEDHDTHHKDECSTNNTPENLEYIHKLEHRGEHNRDKQTRKRENKEEQANGGSTNSGL